MACRQLLTWSPQTETTSADSTTWTVPEAPPQVWTINIKFEYDEYVDYGNCGGYIP
jgi:hypothetical protein